jgi:hypothetical protein
MGLVGPPPHTLTEHALQSDKAANEAVKVDVHVFVRVPHGNDVVELAVEVESCGDSRVEEKVESSRACIVFPAPWPLWLQELQPEPSFLSVTGSSNLGSPPSPFPPALVCVLATPFPPGTCIVDCVSHLIAVDGAGLVCVIMFEDFLNIENSRTGHMLNTSIN